MLALLMLRQKMRATAESKSEWRTADGCDPTPRASLAASEPVVEQGKFEQDEHRTANEEHRERVRWREESTDCSGAEPEDSSVLGEGSVLDDSSTNQHHSEDRNLKTNHRAKVEAGDEADPRAQLPSRINSCSTRIGSEVIKKEGNQYHVCVEAAQNPQSEHSDESLQESSNAPSTSNHRHTLALGYDAPSVPREVADEGCSEESDADLASDPQFQKDDLHRLQDDDLDAHRPIAVGLDQPLDGPLSGWITRDEAEEEHPNQKGCTST